MGSEIKKKGDAGAWVESYQSEGDQRTGRFGAVNNKHGFYG